VCACAGRGAAHTGAMLQAPLLRNSAKVPGVGLWHAARDAVSDVAELWEATATAEYLDSKFSRRHCRSLVPAWWTIVTILDTQSWVNPIPVQCADGACAIGSLIGILLFARSSLRFDTIVLVTYSISIYLNLYLWQKDWGAVALQREGNPSSIIWLQLTPYLSLVFAGIVGTRSTVILVVLLVWIVLWLVFAPSLWYVLFGCALALLLFKFVLSVDTFCTDAFAAHRANEILLQYSSNGFCAIDIESETIRSASDQVVKLFPGTDIVGLRVADLVSGPDKQRLQRLVQAPDRPMEIVQCVDRTAGEAFDCKILRYMHSSKTAWLALQVVGERHAVVTEEVLSGGRPSASGQGDADEVESLLGPASSIPDTTYTGRMFPNLVNASHEIDRDGILAICQEEHCLIPSNQIEVRDAEVASGSFWQVKSGSWKGTPVAIKTSRCLFGSNMSSAEAILNELRMLRLVRHPCLVQFLGVLVSPSTNEFSLIVESAQAPDLCAYLGSPSRVATHRTPSEVERSWVLSQICWVMRHLHTHVPPIVHGSLKDTNIVVEKSSDIGTANPKVKVLDLGFAQMRTTSQTRARAGRSWRYKAPELWPLDPPAPALAMDIFALGGLMFFLASDTKPFSMVDFDHVFFAVNQGRPMQPNWENQKFTEGFWGHLPRHCMEHDPHDRPNIIHIQECVESRWAEPETEPPT